MKKDYKFIEENLLIVLNELREQTDIASVLPPETMSYSDQLGQIEEFICLAGEYGIAYENIISLIEMVPIRLSGKAVIKLIEIALLFGFKTERESDVAFDRR